MQLAQFFSLMVIYVPTILLAVVLHEFTHAWVSHALGDPLPKEEGRLGLNPFSHFDGGSLFLLLIGGVLGGIFLAVRPVRVAPSSYRYPILGQLLVSLSGPLMNLLCAFIVYPLLYFLISVIPLYDLRQGLFSYVLTGIQVNLYIGLLNLIPVPPLDGSYLWLSLFFQEKFQKFRRSLAEYGTWLLLFVVLGLIMIPNPVVSYVMLLINTFSQGILSFWVSRYGKSMSMLFQS